MFTCCSFASSPVQFKQFGLSVCLVVACPFFVAAASIAYILKAYDEEKKPQKTQAAASVRGVESETVQYNKNDVEDRSPSERDSELKTTDPWRKPLPAAIAAGEDAASGHVVSSGDHALVQRVDCGALKPDENAQRKGDKLSNRTDGDNGDFLAEKGCQDDVKETELVPPVPREPSGSE